jgi:hypothetical protein
LLFPVEALLDLIIGGWFELMQMIVPDKFITKGLWITLKIIVYIFSIAVFVVFILGLFAALLTEATVFDLWKLIFIPLEISVVQILLGIVVRCTTKKK